jgi:hypothetical protein
MRTENEMKNETGVLSRIVSGTKLKPPVIVLHGTGGVGKTTLATSGDKAVLLPIEEGWGRLDVSRFPLVTTFAEYADAIAALRNDDHDYKVLAVDSLDWLEPLVWAETLKRFPRPGVDTIEGYGYGKGFFHACDIWREVLGDLKRLRDERNMAIVAIAHSEVRTFNDPANEPYDRFQIKLNKQASALVFEWADAVLFASFDTKTKRDDRRGQTVTRGISTGKRRLFCEERPAYQAKNRYALPAEIDMSWTALTTHIKGEKNNG